MIRVTDFIETAELLQNVPGGRELLDRLDGEPNFGDAEVIGLHLDRNGTSTLQIETQGRHPTTVTFHFEQWIDLSLRGFSQQNVIGALKLRPASERDIAPWELGVGLVPGDIEMELEPCFGVNGTIRARIKSVEFQPADPSASP